MQIIASAAALPRASNAPARDRTIDAEFEERRRLQRLARHLHQLGERAVFEFVSEMVVNYGAAVAERLAQYRRLDPAILRACGGDRLPAPPLRIIA
jgi:hypothetical protein